MNNQKTEAAVRDSNLAVLSNALDLGACVVMSIAGNDIANTVDGKPVQPQYLQQAIAARMQAALSTKTGVR